MSSRLVHVENSIIDIFKDVRLLSFLSENPIKTCLDMMSHRRQSQGVLVFLMDYNILVI